MIIPFQTEHVSLDKAGGKGVNLCKLALAGFPVPDGFIITTEAYLDFINFNNLEDRINRRASQVHLADPETFQNASEEIRSWFGEAITPEALGAKVEQAYLELNQRAVAVRSSATAEDLPGLSFAGQQDTYLNIIGNNALQKAIVNCWSSLWTARAIGYRARNQIPHEGVSLAVIIQTMVPSRASGVLFSANPVSGYRYEMVIDATLGLGEALVSGQVEPDHYIIDLGQETIKEKSIGSKHIIMHSSTSSGVVTEKTDNADIQALSDVQIIQLTKLGGRIADLYDFPQDIEWALADDQFFILQSRPITTLFPIPAGMQGKPLRVMFSFASMQGIVEPITPLGQDAIRLIFAGAANLLGFQVDQETQGFMKIAGGRIWADFTAAVQHPIGVRPIGKFFAVADPGVVNALRELMNEPDLAAGKGKLRYQTLRRVVRFALPMVRRTLSCIHKPEDIAEQIHQASQDEIDKFRVKSRAISGEKDRLRESIGLYRQIRNAFPYVVPNIVPGAAAGLIPLAALNSISNRLTSSNELALEITRGLPHNVTTEMDLALWDTARTIQNDHPSRQVVQDGDAETLAKEFLAGELPETAQQALTEFLNIYGMRGLGEIDIGRPRWNEDPAHIINVLQGYLQINDPNLAPDVVFTKGEAEAEAAVMALQEAARKTFGGRLKARFIRAASRRVRALAGLRESPKFHIINMMWIIRKVLLDRGAELVSKGELELPDDLFYLYLNELILLAEGNDQNWRDLIKERRKQYQQELLRRQIPRLLLSDGRVFYEGITPGEDTEGQLRGSPVSPGLVVGKVRVVINPVQVELVPGEILVCQATDPAWTPLFLSAGGLVMELGGMITHGAIVAREYGIPAVVGINNATSILQDGQVIMVNGSTGEIAFLDEAHSGK